MEVPSIKSILTILSAPEIGANGVFQRLFIKHAHKHTPPFQSKAFSAFQIRRLFDFAELQPQGSKSTDSETNEIVPHTIQIMLSKLYDNYV